MTRIKKFKLGVLGAQGRMGREISTLLLEPRFFARLESVDSPFSAEAVLDFASPAAVLEYCREALRRKVSVPLVVGSTGWTEAELRELDAAAVAFPILRAANFSLGIQICKMTLANWKSLPSLANWRVSIRDLHHAGKKDAPSGTALSLREALGREVKIESIREGEIIGTHEVILENEFETIRLIHEAKSRTVFADGALEAVLELLNANPASLPRRLLGLDDLYLRRDA